MEADEIEGFQQQVAVVIEEIEGQPSVAEYPNLNLNRKRVIIAASVLCGLILMAMVILGAIGFSLKDRAESDYIQNQKLIKQNLDVLEFCPGKLSVNKSTCETLANLIFEHGELAVSYQCIAVLPPRLYSSCVAVFKDTAAPIDHTDLHDMLDYKNGKTIHEIALPVLGGSIIYFICISKPIMILLNLLNVNS